MSKKKKRRANIPPATLLRPRLENLWADDVLLHKESAAIEEELKVLARDVTSDLFVATALRAYEAASKAAQAKLDEVLPGWLAENGHAETLHGMMAAQSLAPGLHRLALTWLEAADVDTDGLEAQPSLFMEAYYLDDEEGWGAPSQAQATVFWYTDYKKNQARGFSFLLDYNPPWDGSVKDVYIVPQRSPKSLIAGFKKVWDDSLVPLELVSPERIKTVILKALHCNREAEIRLPRDLINARSLFEDHVLSLPDGPDTPTFTMGDFDILAQQGKAPAQLMHIEQTMGRRVRGEDGEEVVIMDLRGPKNIGL